MGELGDHGWDFYSGKENPFLPLEGDVFGPPDKSGEISCGLNMVADSEVSGSFFEEGVCLLFDLLDCSLAFSAFALN